MRHFSVLELVEHVSRMTNEPIMAVTVDPYAQFGEFVPYDGFDPEEAILDSLEGVLDRRTCELLTDTCEAIVSYEDLTAVYSAYSSIQAAIPFMANNIELTAVVYHRGEKVLAVRQDGQPDPQISLALEAAF